MPHESVVGRVVSGGQTGADRAALDVALAHGIEHGGWCPAGGWAEDEPEPPGLLVRYPGLRATPSADPAQRTAWNVRDSDVTLVLVRGAGWSSPGTELTLDEARRLGRPSAVVDIDQPLADAVDQVLGLLATAPPAPVLNVAGPRESESPGLHAAASRVLTAVLSGPDRAS